MTGSPAGQDRLNEWKEIAGHFGKSQRTVQRWEKDYGLPVHRIQKGKRSGIVYALVAEINDWLRKCERANGEKSADGQTSDAGLAPSLVESANPPGSNAAPPQRLLVAAAVLILLGAFAALAAWGWSPAGGPEAWEISGNRLIVTNRHGAVIWQYAFDFLLEPSDDPRKAAILDLEGDGSKEVLFVTGGIDYRKRALFCFESNGALRYRHQVEQSVVFGSTTYAGVFPAIRFGAFPDTDGRHSVWLISAHHSQFPGVLERLDSRGNVLSQYWSNGHLESLGIATANGRRVIIVGGTTNEFRRASLAVLDYEAADASAPAETPHYRCSSCPNRAPLAFVVLPQPDVWQWRGGAMTIHWIKTFDTAEPAVLETLGREPLPLSNQMATWSTRYWLDADLNFARADHGDDYVHTHRQLHHLKHLDHEFSEADRRQLWPVLRWKHDSYVEDWGPQKP